ncbi:hypothetical protein CCMA1212_006931 [Trichoderma ghanense]|uniref:Uncharacterized protein n=1 Tax=Trichoderma ghanense TaxID=65468 RepID=A0ABY2H222_9HYPO
MAENEQKSSLFSFCLLIAPSTTQRLAYATSERSTTFAKSRRLGMKPSPSPSWSVAGHVAEREANRDIGPAMGVLPGIATGEPGTVGNDDDKQQCYSTVTWTSGEEEDQGHSKAGMGKDGEKIARRMDEEHREKPLWA